MWSDSYDIDYGINERFERFLVGCVGKTDVAISDLSQAAENFDMRVTWREN